MKLNHSNGHAALHVVQPRNLPPRVDIPGYLRRAAAMRARKPRPAGGESQPQPNLPTVTPTPAPPGPAAPVGNRKRRQPAHQPPARTKAPVAPHRPKGGTAAGKATGGKPGRPPTRGEGTKKAQVLALLRRTQGATLAELVGATGWQAHSVRGFLSGAVGKKMGLKLKSGKRADGVRVYSIPA